MVNRNFKVVLMLLVLFTCAASAQKARVRDYGIEIGFMATGENNAITDVMGVRVGHFTLVSGEDIRTGVTAVLPHSGNIMGSKVPAAMYIANGFGKMTGYSQVEELEILKHRLF